MTQNNPDPLLPKRKFAPLGRFIIYPILLPLFPILNFFDHNFNQLYLPELGQVIGIAIVMVIAFWAALHFIFNDKEKTGLVVALTFFSLFSYRQLSTTPSTLDFDNTILPFGIVNNISLSALTLLLLSVATFLIKKIRLPTVFFTRLLTILSFTLVLIPLFSIGMKQYVRLTHRKIQEKNLMLVPFTKPAQKALPDIYYLVIEQYANNDSLKNYYKFDNQAFIDFLESRGFWVAKDTAANYPDTYSSLAASFTMQYHDELTKSMGKFTNDAAPFNDEIDDNKLIHFLKNLGYRYLVFDYTANNIYYNKNSDYNYVYTSRNPLTTETNLNQMQLQQNFVATFLLKKLGPIIGQELRNEPNKWRISIDQMIDLSLVPQKPGPKFVYLHSLITHPPFDFGRNGYPLSETLYADGYFPDRYVDQLVFTNGLLQNLIDTIMHDSETPPIIILQADEGPLPKRYIEQGVNFDWQKATIDEMKQKNKILNAYLLPTGDTKQLYPSISPVNSFRVVLNQYFGQHLPLLPDKTYMFSHQDRPYDYFEITGFVH